VLLRFSNRSQKTSSERNGRSLPLVYKENYNSQQNDSAYDKKMQNKLSINKETDSTSRMNKVWSFPFLSLLYRTDELLSYPDPVKPYVFFNSKGAYICPV